MPETVTVLAQGVGTADHPAQTAPTMARSATRDAVAERTDRFVRLYQELFPSVHGYIRFRVRDVHAAEDLTGQVFERALARLGSVRDAGRVRAWIFTIARNAVADYRRGRRAARD